MPKGVRVNFENFINQATEKFPQYDLSLIEAVHFKNLSSKVTIICPKHGNITQSAYTFINTGKGCAKCNFSINGKKQSKNFKKNISITVDVFLERSGKIHNFKYDYSKVIWNNLKSKIIIICPIHGEFIQTAKSHLTGHGCRLCVNNFIGLDDLRSIVIDKANKIHNFKYDYSACLQVKSIRDKIKIICPIHGIFEQKANSHYKGTGCPRCQMSKGEQKIENWLKDQNIYYITQKKFTGLKFKRLLKFDFYLPNFNMCIEYDGEGHYKVINRSSKDTKESLEKSFNDGRIKDELKNKYCKNNNIKLLRIPYWRLNHIDKILKNIFSLNYSNQLFSEGSFLTKT